MSLARTWLFSVPLILLSTVVLGTMTLVASLFDRDGDMQHRLAQFWAKTLLAVSFVRVRSQGVEKLDPRGSYVFVANHGSLMDIPAALAVLPQQFRFFAKKGLYKIPFLGSHLHRAGHLPVDYANPRNSLKSMTEGASGGGPRHFDAALPGRRPFGERTRRLQGGRGVHRDQGGSADCSSGHRRNARAAADRVGAFAQRQGDSAGGRPDFDQGTDHQGPGATYGTAI
jgi:1-acyl-sn-glycerol-3-phosphate acyltransferase